MQMNMNLNTNPKANKIFNISFWAQMTHNGHLIFINKSVSAQISFYECWIWFNERKIVNFKQFLHRILIYQNGIYILHLLHPNSHFLE